MNRWLVRFGYDGAAFAGWARQPSSSTIEGTLLRGLARQARGHPVGSFDLEVASRTDRGVSAVSNALAIRSDLSGGRLLRQLNGIDPRLFFTAVTSVPDSFRVRNATRRVYRYFQSDPVDIDRWQRAAALFTGPIDVRSFGRGLSPTAPTWRPIESVSVTMREGGTCIEVRARSFVWGMVRKIIGALREHDRGRLPLSRLQSAIEGRERLTLPMAEAEGLVLWEVEYPFPWGTEWSGPNRYQVEFVRSARREIWSRNQVIAQLFGPVPAGERRPYSGSVAPEPT